MTSDETEVVVSGLLAQAAELERQAERLRSTASLIKAYEDFDEPQVEDLEDVIRNLEEAMKKRGVIEQAKGMLMAQDPELDADGAFAVLRTTSQRENVKVRDIAQRVVEARDPDSGR